MSEFDHIEITIENVATDGTRTRPTQWRCPSVDIGVTGGRVRLLFDGEGVPVPAPYAFWTPLDTALALDAAARRRVTATCTPAPLETCATEAPRDVATDPKPGDRILGASFRRAEWYRVMQVSDDGVHVDSDGGTIPPDRCSRSRRDWAAECRAAGVIVDRVSTPERDVATDPRVGDRVTSPGGYSYTVSSVAGEWVVATTRYQGFARGAYCYGLAGWREMCGPGAVIERAGG